MSTGDGSAVSQVQAGLAVLNAADVVGLPDEQVRSEILALLTCMNQLTGALLARIGTFDLRDLSQVDAAVEHLISLCRYHHGLLHEGHWTLAMDRATGEVSARRPDGSPYVRTRPQPPLDHSLVPGTTTRPTAAPPRAGGERPALVRRGIVCPIGRW